MLYRNQRGQGPKQIEKKLYRALTLNIDIGGSSLLRASPVTKALHELLIARINQICIQV